MIHEEDFDRPQCECKELLEILEDTLSYLDRDEPDVDNIGHVVSNLHHAMYLVQKYKDELNDYELS